MGKNNVVKRPSDSKTLRLDKQEAEQADIDARAKRVILVDINGVPINSPGRNFYYEDTSFETGDSPVVLDVNTDLGRNATDGNIINDGPGDILVEVSNDGTNYGTQITLTDCDQLELKNMNVDSIRLTWQSDSAYRILVI